MRYFKNIKFILFTAILLSLQGCSDFLEQEPGTQISITEQLKTKQGVLQALNGVYGSLESNLRGGNFAVYSDLQGGNIKFTPSITQSTKGQISTPSTIANIYAFDDISNTSNLAYFYSNSYTIINLSNLILEFTDALTDATDAEKNQIKAQALTIRAYAHFLLSEVYSQNYGFTEDASHLGIVYSTTSLNDGLKYPARETAANTYKLLVEDLTAALNLYSDATLLSGPVYSYFTKTSAQALLARVYLAKKDWQNAYNISNDIITGSGVNLVSSSDYISEWAKPDLPVSEILLEFSIPRSTDGVSSGSMSAHFGYTTDTSYGNYVASEDLINLYETSDIRRQLFQVQSISTIVNLQPVNRNYYFTRKFQGNPGYVAFRLSEQYLIRAEASLELNNTAQAKEDINTIRIRANASTLSDTENLRDALFLERRKELCFEGFLFFDIARNKKDVSRNDGCISLNCSITYPSSKYVLPIPRNNINLNPNLKQNESY
ncbi:RagB/SusD family nutrient uptake outer membrane protein [Flavobacterium foetidum]|uniref:RagB/SusD family nutrient uptake outer membrane protein n=1 Tax=Flavobacterium foetidum TaxID=2026681 RepID=UPI001074CB17|nr:RagB/SusD family nutrient uptake outer membrane protein [Flavobacterium foetidum]KAF2506592.1 RagB/SusD family nutrient uptake outer membrane protein [Flavobacterium foetidum]